MLYEMLSGEPPFAGPTAQAIVARMMTEEPRPLVLQRHSIPPNVEAAVRRALEKLPADRFAGAAEFRAALRDSGFVGHPTHVMASVARPTPRRRALATIPWLVALAAVVTAAVVLFRPKPLPPVERYGLALPAGQRILAYPVTPSPDGSMLLFVGPVPGQASDLVFQLWLKQRDRADATPLGGTATSWNATFSPDGRWVAFINNRRLMKVAVTGGAAVALADSAAPAQPGIAWMDDGYIVFVERGAKALRRVDSRGGPSQVVFRSELALFQSSPLPGSHAVLAGQCGDRGCLTAQVIAVDLRSGTARTLVTGAGIGRYLSTGHLFYVTDALAGFVVPFDAGKVRVTGPPVAVLDSLAGSIRADALVGVSAGGTLTYRQGGGVLAAAGEYELAWVDRTGAVSPIAMGGRLKIDNGAAR